MSGFWLSQLSGWSTREVDDAWTAAIVSGHLEGGALVARQGRKLTVQPGKLERGWTIEGALALVDLLPDELADLREDLVASFADRQAAT